MEVQTGKSEKNAGQVGQGDVLGSAQQVLGQSDKVSTPTAAVPSLPESPDFTQQQLPRTQLPIAVLETLFDSSRDKSRHNSTWSGQQPGVQRSPHKPTGNCSEVFW